MRNLLQHVVEAGFPHPRHLIHLFVGGSELHGAKLQGTDDLDIYGIFIEPPELGLGLQRYEHFVWSTAGDERRNGPNDIDVTLYSLRKWAGLACKGNPTALHFLFVASELANGDIAANAWRRVWENKHLFLARSCMPQFLGFADAQLKRLTGELGRGKKGQRPELEQRYSYDVKAAMHSIRLLHEGKELIQNSNITLPRPEKNQLISIRSGGFSLEQILEMAKKLFDECKEAERLSALPATVDRDAVSRLVAEVYLAYWDEQRAYDELLGCR